jgi:hypothetical protein
MEAVEAGLVGIEPKVGGGKGGMDGGNCSVFGVARGSTEHGDTKDGSKVDADSAEGIAVVGVGDLLQTDEVSHYQRPGHELERKLAAAQKRMKQCCLPCQKVNLWAVI